MYVVMDISDESFSTFLLVYLLPLMSKWNMEIKSIEFQSRHPIRKYVSSLNSCGFQHFKTDDCGG